MLIFKNEYNTYLFNIMDDKTNHCVEALLTCLNLCERDSNKLKLFYTFQRWTKPYENRGYWPPILKFSEIELLLNVMESDEYKIEVLKIIKYVIDDNEDILYRLQIYLNKLDEPHRSIGIDMFK